MSSYKLYIWPVLHINKCFHIHHNNNRKDWLEENDDRVWGGLPGVDGGQYVCSVGHDAASVRASRPGARAVLDGAQLLPDWVRAQVRRPDAALRGRSAVKDDGPQHHAQNILWVGRVQATLLNPDMCNPDFRLNRADGKVPVPSFTYPSYTHNPDFAWSWHKFRVHISLD